MLNRTRILSIVTCVYGLTACSTFDSSPNNTTYPPDNRQWTQVYPEGYEGSSYSDVSHEKKPISVPETYHVGAYHSPAPHTDRDREWVNSQNPQGYTIEVADDDKASNVAKTLFNAPKNERMAEIKYQREGKTHYKGVYGTYPNYEAAQKALSTLPDDMKQKAGIKSWGTVQGSESH